MNRDTVLSMHDPLPLRLGAKVTAPRTPTAAEQKAAAMSDFEHMPDESNAVTPRIVFGGRIIWNDDSFGLLHTCLGFIDE